MNYVEKCLFACLIQICCFSSIFAQTYIEDPTPIEYILRVKQIGEFMERFNRERVPEGIDMSANLADERCIALLFDREFALKDSMFCMDFCHAMVSEDVKLHYEDSSWVAIAELDATLNGKSVDIFLRLKPEQTGDGAYKWVICGAEGSILMLTADNTNPGQFIMPTDNEMDFMSLPDVVETQYLNIVNYASDSYNIDPLSVFLTLVKYKHLKVNHVSRLRYLFNVPSYSFVVSFLYRETMNSGWLITEINKENVDVKKDDFEDLIDKPKLGSDSIPQNLLLQQTLSDY